MIEILLFAFIKLCVISCPDYCQFRSSHLCWPFYKNLKTYLLLMSDIRRKSLWKYFNCRTVMITKKVGTIKKKNNSPGVFLSKPIFFCLNKVHQRYNFLNHEIGLPRKYSSAYHGSSTPIFSHRLLIASNWNVYIMTRIIMEIMITVSQNPYIIFLQITHESYEIEVRFEWKSVSIFWSNVEACRKAVNKENFVRVT